MSNPQFGMALALETEESSDYSLIGEISEHNLSDVLQFLETGRKTGLLSIQDDHPVGLVHLEKGVITFAQTHTFEGAEAVYEILSQESGLFRFYPDKTPVRGNCRLAATDVLLQWARRMDEKRRPAVARA